MQGKFGRKPGEHQQLLDFADNHHAVTYKRSASCLKLQHTDTGKLRSEKPPKLQCNTLSKQMSQIVKQNQA